MLLRYGFRGTVSVLLLCSCCVFVDAIIGIESLSLLVLVLLLVLCWCYVGVDVKLLLVSRCSCI